MWVKVCGCTDPQNAAAVAAVGVEAIGLNFYPKSKRFIATAGQAVRDAIGEHALAIGLFVDEEPDRILDAVEKFDLDAVQLHGHESIEAIVRLAPVPVYRAVRVSPGTIADRIQTVVDAASAHEVANLSGILVDADSSRGLGGTGQTIDWDEMGETPRELWPHLVLAGGLTSDNVFEAVRTARPYGVDVASGVESAPGLKDLDMVRQFVDQARLSESSPSNSPPSNSSPSD